jgi:Streptomyces sporulation and cell division protein, SsgA
MYRLSEGSTMLHPSHTVTTPLTLSVSASTGDADMQAELRYDPSDPLAVTLAIGIECASPVIWVFGRDLLAEGVNCATGEGDITVEPSAEGDRREIRITLATDCLATMTADRDKVLEFLVASFTAVPSGCEMDQIDFDAEIAALLS